MAFLEHLLPNLYKSAEYSQNWSIVLDQIKDEMQVGSAVIQMLHDSGEQLREEWVVRDTLSTKNSEIHDRLVNNYQNPRLNKSAFSWPVQGSHSVFDEKKLNTKSSEFEELYKRLKILGLGKSLVLGLKYSNTKNLCLILHRNYSDTRDFKAEKIRTLDMLAPHLKQAVSISEKIARLDQKSSAFSDTLSFINSGIVILDNRGEVFWINEKAHKIIEHSRYISCDGKVVNCHRSQDQNILVELIMQARDKNNICEHAQTVGIIGEAFDKPLQVLSIPICNGELGGNSFDSNKNYIALYLSEQDNKVDLDEDDVISLFGLTTAEARLALALTSGYSLSEYARNKRISIGTTRIQLKSIFSKLNINRQSELVLLISASISNNILK